MIDVVILRGDEPEEIVFEAMNIIKPTLLNLIDERTILIKPNFINSKHPSTGVTTDSRVIEGVIKFFVKYTKNKLVIGEGSGWTDTFQAFKVAGIDKVANKWGVSLIDLNKDDFIEIYPSNPFSLTKVKVAKTVLESIIVSVPKLKLHKLTCVSLSLKNMMGALANKGCLHNGYLNQNIVDLSSTLKPHISVIDGIIAGEGDETSTDPLRMNVVITGTDPVAVDTVGAAVMGVNPKNVKHLSLAEKKGLGTSNLKKINIIGEKIETVQRIFKRK